MLHVVTGGSGSGKSQFAEDLVSACDSAFPRIYIATMHIGHDPENQARVKKHVDRRADMNFQTIECETALNLVSIPQNAVVLLEDMSNLVANEFFLPDGSGMHCISSILTGIDRLCETAKEVIIVTNEVFSDGRRYDADTELYLRFLGTINCEIAARADAVTEVVYGIPVAVKQTADLAE